MVYYGSIYFTFCLLILWRVYLILWVAGIAWVEMAHIQLFVSNCFNLMAFGNGFPDYNLMQQEMHEKQLKIEIGH